MARTTGATGFLSRLRKDVRGNTLVIVAAAILPLIGMIGGAVDLSRLYLTRVRLQHACDAGALAGRKQMGGGAWNSTAQASAGQFFWGNFHQNAYGTGTATAAFTSSGTDVHGVASTTVPMTLMAIFSAPPRTISVTCDSQMQLPNTDVMFVLDNTGSMLDKANSSDPMDKIDTLKNAVKCFYEVLAQYKTNGTCTTAISGTGINSDSQLRFGFVPYTTNVNVSQLGLPASYFATTWNYQSRQQTGSWSSWSNTSSKCSNVPANTNTVQYQTSGSGNNCKVQSRSWIPSWLYGSVPLPFDVTSALTSFSGSNPPSSTTVSLPIGNGYTNRSVQWDGCLEEQTVTSNINQIPSQSTAGTLYAPALPDAIYMRKAASGSGSVDTSSMTTSSYTTTSNYYNSVRANYYFCPKPAKKLQTWSATNFDSYVDSLAAAGNTYHDIGMLWGGRLISPEGMFTSENKQTPTGGQIMRHVIFMTDGDAQAAACDYTVYGLAWYDNRTGSNVGSAKNCPSGGSQSNQSVNSLWSDVNTRLLALCASVKKEPNTTLWVISFGGSGIAQATKTNLQTCATDTNHYFDATNATQLNSAFQMIAAQITQLRLTQ